MDKRPTILTVRRISLKQLVFLVVILLFLVGCSKESSEASHQVDTYDHENLNKTYSEVFQGQTENWKVLNEIQGGETSNGKGKAMHSITILPIGANPRGDINVESLTINGEAYPLSEPVTFKKVKGNLQAKVILVHNEPVILSGDKSMKLTVSTDSEQKDIELSP